MSGLTSSATVVRSVDGAFTVRWSARDNVGATGYQYRLRHAPTGTWSTASSTTATSHVFKTAAGTWEVGVRARDAVGNWGDWRVIRVIVPADDRSYSFSSGTVRRVSSVDYRGTLTTTSRPGARLSVTFTGTGFYLVGRSGPAYGRLRVTIDGRSWMVDSGMYAGKRATATRHKVLLFGKSLTPGRHVVTITNLATAGRPTIALDGLGFAR